MRWLYFIGGYYTPRKFVAETKDVGANRKVSSRLAKSFSFGDTVICLYYLRGMVKAFAEFRVDRISFDGAQGIGQELERQGKASFSEGPQNHSGKNCY